MCKFLWEWSHQQEYVYPVLCLPCSLFTFPLCPYIMAGSTTKQSSPGPAIAEICPGTGIQLADDLLWWSTLFPGANTTGPETKILKHHWLGTKRTNQTSMGILMLPIESLWRLENNPITGIIPISMRQNLKKSIEMFCQPRSAELTSIFALSRRWYPADTHGVWCLAHVCSSEVHRRKNIELYEIIDPFHPQLRNRLQSLQLISPITAINTNYCYNS